MNHQESTVLPPDNRLAYKTSEAAKVLGMCRATLWKETSLGRIKKTPLGLYPRFELERYLKAELKRNP